MRLYLLTYSNEYMYTFILTYTVNLKWNITYSSPPSPSTTSIITLPIDFCPFVCKLMHMDEFTCDNNDNNNQTIQLFRRPKQTHCGELVLQGNKSYGKYKQKKLWRFMFRDTRYGSALVPYEMGRIGFSKNWTNVFLTVVIDHWGPTDSHPIALCMSTIGQVSDNLALEDYDMYHYQVGIAQSIKRLQQLCNNYNNCNNNKREEEEEEEKEKEEECVYDQYIFSIDPAGCTDIDDAIGLSPHTIDVYISNPIPVFDSIENSWNSLSERVSSIYLANQRRVPMLPSFLSENACSLKARSGKRHALRMRIDIRDATTSFTMVELMNGIWKNFAYEDTELLSSKLYIQLFTACQHLFSIHPFSNIEDNEIKNSHDVICYLMTLFNVRCAEYMHLHSIPAIYRTYDPLVGARYSYSPHPGHCILQTDKYMHITSPIRRLPDLINMRQIHQFLLHHNETKNNLEYNLEWLNQQAIAIRRVQSHSLVRNLDTTLTYAATIAELGGYVKLSLNGAYIKVPNMASSFYSIGDKVNIQLFMFVNEAQTWRRIRAVII